jgi:hypothetical protein
MDTTVASSEGRDEPSAGIQKLEELRLRLVKAQRGENTAIRNLSALTVQGAVMNKVQFQAALDEVHLARTRTIAAYDAWSRGVERFKEIPSQPREESSNERADGGDGKQDSA